jgi:hypothetical protein
MFEVTAEEKATAPDSLEATRRTSARNPTSSARAQQSTTEPIAEPVAASPTESLIVFRDSEAELTPSLPPPLLAELPPAAAREPRIQLRGQRDANWQLARRN